MRTATHRHRDSGASGVEAGAAVRDISPKGPTFLVGFPHVERISQGVHDPLLASALYLRSPVEAVLLIALDLLFLDPATARALRRRVAARTGVPEAGVFISCSHTHSGPNTATVLEWGPSPVVPDVDADYMQQMQDTVVETAVAAMHRPQAARVAWLSAQAQGVGGNRHDPERGPSDPEVGVLAVAEAASGRIFALSMIYSMHPTVLHEDSPLVSADFPHFTREFLKRAIHPDLTVLYHNGPEGDQSPRHAVTANTFEEARRIGELLGRAVHERVAELRDEDFVSDPPLASRLAPVVLPRRMLPSVEEAAQTLARLRGVHEQLQRQGAPHGPVRTAECDVFGGEETAYLAECSANGRLAEVLEAYTPVDIQAVRIGDTCLVGLPGELFVDFGLDLKRRAKRRCFPVSLVNGELQGYIVTLEAIDRGVYEANNRVFGAEAGDILVATALGLLRTL